MESTGSQHLSESVEGGKADFDQRASGCKIQRSMMKVDLCSKLLPACEQNGSFVSANLQV